MNTNKLPNLGSTGWGKSLNDYIEGIETRVSDLEHGLSEAREPEKVFNISSGVVGFGGKMKQGDDVLESGEELDDETSYFWEGDVFFKDTGDGFPLNVTMNENTSFSLEDLGALETGWNPVYLFLNDDGNVIYRVDSTNAYLTHPLLILLGFIFYDGSKKYWYYKTSRSEENTYEKRFMLTKPLAKFNSTFSVGVNGNRYAIIGKKVGTANPTLTLNAMGINYENSSISSEELVRGPDYKEFTVKEDTPIIWATTNPITFETSDGFELSGDRSIHRVYFSNIGYYVVQSEKYSGSDDFSSVVGYSFQPMNANLERYGDLVELFRFVTVGTEGEGNFINVYQAIGSGIPPVDSFGVVPEVNYVSREGSNNIQFTDSSNNYFTLIGQNYTEGATPKVVRLNFNNSNDNYNYHALMNYTDISTTNGIQFKGANTVYDFTTNNLSLELSPNRYIKMGVTDGFQGIELKNDNSIISMNNDGLLNIQADTNKRLWMGHAEEESSGVGLRNDESRIVLADNGNIDLSSQNINLNAASVEIEAPSVDIVSSDVDIEASDVDIESSDMRVTGDNILIRTNKNSWPEELISSTEYVFDPQVYRGVLLRDRYMGTQYDVSPWEGGEANLMDMDINQAFYKTADNYWWLGLWGGQTHLGGEYTTPSTYLVVVRYYSEENKYKFDFVKKVEGYTAAEKEDPFVFSVSPHDTCSLTGAWGNERNDAFYVASNPGLIDIEAQSAQHGINKIRLNSSNLSLSKDEIDYLTISNTGVLSNLKVGTDNYKLVFLNDTTLVTEHVPNAGVYWKVYGEEDGKKYLLNNFPILGKQVFGATVSWRVGNTNNERYGYWYGNFPLIFFSPDAEEKFVGVTAPGGRVRLAFFGSDGFVLTLSEDPPITVTINGFTGWAWEIIN